MKNKILSIIAFALLTCNISASEDSVEIKKYPSNDLITKIFLKPLDVESDQEVENLNKIFTLVDSQEYFSDYKKHLIKNLSMLNYQAFLLVDKDKELHRIAKYTFPLSMCAAFQFKEDLMRIMGETSSIFIKTEEDGVIFSNAFKKMEDLYLNQAQIDFDPDIDFFQQNCSN